MSFFELLSLSSRFVFTFIIYLFIYSVVKLIYTDVRKTLSDQEYNELPKSQKESTPASTDENYDDYIGRLEIIESKADAADEYLLCNESVVIGRNDDCDISLHDIHMSGEHAHLYYEKDRWYIEDLNSRNGTKVNNKKITKATLLYEGDQIEVGSTIFRLA